MTDAMAYKPSSSALAHLAGVDLVAVVGPTAGGKTTIINNALSRDRTAHQVLTTISRVPRPGERDGVDFHAASREAMETRIAKGEYVQVVRTVFSDIYATAPEDYTTEGIALLPVMAEAIAVFRALPFKRFRTCYILPADYDAWYARIAERQFTPEQLAKRLAEARVSFLFAAQDPEVVIIENDTVEAAVAAFLAFLHGRPVQQDTALKAKARSYAARLL